MRLSLFRTFTIISLFTLSVTAVRAQKAQFSADMQLLNADGHNETVKLYVGNQRARLERVGAATDSTGINALIIDFYHQMLYLLIPQSKVYLRIAGSEGSTFYNAAWIFRPISAEKPCSQWVAEADLRSKRLKCQKVGDENVGGRTAQKWEASTVEGGHGVLWYDPSLNFIVKVLRSSKSATNSGYELRNIVVAAQPDQLFNPYKDYREFSLTKLLDVLTGVSEW